MTYKTDFNTLEKIESEKKNIKLKIEKLKKRYADLEDKESRIIAQAVIKKSENSNTDLKEILSTLLDSKKEKEEHIELTEEVSIETSQDEKSDDNESLKMFERI